MRYGNVSVLLCFQQRKLFESVYHSEVKPNPAVPHLTTLSN